MPAKGHLDVCNILLRPYSTLNFKKLAFCMWSIVWAGIYGSRHSRNSSELSTIGPQQPASGSVILGGLDKCQKFQAHC